MNILWVLVKCLFWLSIGLAFIQSALTHFIWWYESRLSKLENHETTKISVPVLIKSFLIESLCLLKKTALYPFQNRSFDSKSFRNDGLSPPILLVHGYLNHKADWFWFLKKLQKYSHLGPIYSINLNPPLASISQLAVQLKEKVSEIRANTRATQIILIGHSMGGLVNSYFAEYLANPEEVAMVITLGSPFQGTKLSALGYGQNAKEMRPNSPFLAELKARIHQSHIPYYSIASKVDNMIIPWQSALVLDEMSKEKTMILEDHGHLRLLMSTPIVEQITKWIDLSFPNKRLPSLF